MTRLKNIALLILLLVTGQGVVWAQTNGDFDKAYTFAQSGNFDSARACLDRYLVTPAAEKDADAWYLYGFVNQRLFRTKDMGNHLSSFRTEAVKGFKKSFDIDHSAENRSRNREGFCSLSLSFYNSAVQTLDSMSFDKSEKNYAWYREVVVYCDTNINLKAKDIEFNLALATRFEDKLAASKNVDTTAFDSARDAYQRILDVDPRNIKANYNLGVLYHNFAVNLIMSAPEDDFPGIIKVQERADVLFKKALPFGKFGLDLPDTDPKKLEYVTLLYQLYNNLNETEKAEQFKKMMDDLTRKKGG